LVLWSMLGLVSLWGQVPIILQLSSLRVCGFVFVDENFNGQAMVLCFSCLLCVRCYLVRWSLSICNHLPFLTLLI
jgi:hypothetical protein